MLMTVFSKSDSKEFIASDGLAYKWKHHSHGVWEVRFSMLSVYSMTRLTPLQLLTQDGSHTLVARYDRKAISIYPQALHIADEVIVTLFYMRQYKKKEDDEAIVNNGIIAGLNS